MSLHPELCGLMDREFPRERVVRGTVCEAGGGSRGQYTPFPGLLWEGGFWGRCSLQVTIVRVRSTEAGGLAPDGVVSYRSQGLNCRNLKRLAI